MSPGTTVFKDTAWHPCSPDSAFATAVAALAAGCNSESGRNSGPGLRPHPGRHAGADVEKGHDAQRADPRARLQEGIRDRGLEAERATGKYVHLKTYPVCRWSGQLGPKKTEGDRQVPEGFYTVAAVADEPELGLLALVQRRLSQPDGTRHGPHRRRHHGARHLLVARLLRHDERPGRGDLRGDARGLQRRPAQRAVPVLSVPDDGGEPRPVPARPQHAPSGRT